MRDEHVRAQPGPPDCSIQGASLGGEGLPSAPPPQRAPLTSWGGPSALPQMRGGTPCVCLCFAAHSQPWARSHTAWHPWVCFCTPTHTCARSHTALHTCVHTCACSRTALHALTRLPRCHSLAHPCTLSHTRTCSCTPMHTLSRALHACAPSPTAWHTCTHTCTPVHILVHFCMLFHNPAHSFTPLMLSQPCTPVHFTPCAHSHPPRAHSHLAVPSGPAPVLLHTPCTSLPPRVLARPSCPCPALGALARSTRSCTLTPSTPWWPQLLGVPCGFTPLPGCPLCVPHSWSGLTPLSRRVRPGMLRGAEH